MGSDQGAVFAYKTRGGIAVTRRTVTVAYGSVIEPLAEALDSHRGVLLSSGYEVPGRYTRWDIGFIDPPLALTARGLEVVVEALNPRGRVLLAVIAAALAGLEVLEGLETGAERLRARVRRSDRRFTEEERSRQPSVFSVLRAIIALFHSPEDARLGLYGAFGYDLAFQFEPIPPARPRGADQRDLVLYLPDRLVVQDHRRQEALVIDYRFTVGGQDTEALRGGRIGRPRPGRAGLTMRPAAMPRWCGWPRRRSAAATCSRSCPARLSPIPVRRRRRRCSGGSACAIRRLTGS
jgi:anthranilate synthase